MNSVINISFKEESIDLRLLQDSSNTKEDYYDQNRNI
jgi:hypothetical protein